MKLVLENLSVARGTRTVIADLSMTIGAGECVVLTGANGAGKTTLIKCVAGLLEPAAGRAFVETNAGADDDIAQHCHYAGHVNALKASLTVLENLQFWANYLSGSGHGDRDGRAERALVRLALDDLADIPTAYLSAGQKRRAALARLLTAERPIWLLDEPTVSLDEASAGIVASLVNEHTSAGGIALLATHVPLALTEPRTLHLVPARVFEAAV